MKKEFNFKHNRWIEGLDAGETFFNFIAALGYGLLMAVGVLTLFVAWTFIALTYSEWFSTAVLVIKVLRLALWTFILGFILKYLCHFLAEYLYTQEIKEMENYVQLTNGKKREPNKRKK